MKRVSIRGRACWSQLAEKVRHALESEGRRGVMKLQTLCVMQCNADGESWQSIGDVVAGL